LEYLFEYGLFFAKVITIVIALVVIIGIIVSSASGQTDSDDDGELQVTYLNEQYNTYKNNLDEIMLDEEAWKVQCKQDKKDKKAKTKAEKVALKQAEKKSADDADINQRKPRLFVLDFDGDIRASDVEPLRTEITALLMSADPELKDKVLIRLESGGGMVHSYGFASSQLSRIRDKGIDLTVAVDKVAASGGYMMACVANHIVAAPFSIIGSIGVLAQIPNFNKLLKKYDIDYEQLSAGEFKRTLTMFGENTDKGREKFMEELEETHRLFKNFVSNNRPDLDINKVATGEHWYGQQALELNLVDQLTTSDDYILQHIDECDVYTIAYTKKKTIIEKLGINIEVSLDNLFWRWLKHDRETHLL